MVGSGKGAENGILFKNAEALQMLHKADVIVFDKTGTLTKGKPDVTDIVAYSGKENDVLKIAAVVEKQSEHPLASAIVNRAKSSETSTWKRKKLQGNNRKRRFSFCKWKKRYCSETGSDGNRRRLLSRTEQWKSSKMKARQ